MFLSHSFSLLLSFPLPLMEQRRLSREVWVPETLSAKHIHRSSTQEITGEQCLTGNLISCGVGQAPELI